MQSNLIIDQVKLDGWGTGWIPKDSIFYTKRTREVEEFVSLEGFEDTDIINTNLSRLQLELLHLIDTEEILEKNFNKKIDYKKLNPEFKDRLKQVLIKRVWKNSNKSIKEFCQWLEYYYCHDVLGMDCK